MERVEISQESVRSINERKENATGRKERLTFQLRLPPAKVPQNTSHLTPTTPQATFIPLQGTSPVARMTSSFRHVAPDEVMLERTMASWVGKRRRMIGERGRERR